MVFLGVDCGGTKISYVLSDESGHILGRHISPGGTFWGSGVEGLTKLLSPAITETCRKADIQKDDITYAGFGFPGYGEGKDSEQAIMDMCRAIIGHGRVACECDSYLGWAGSLAMEPGINIISGTGSICFGVNKEGLTARTSGWGSYCDEGSCRWIGGKLLECFTKQADGRIQRTPLYALCKEYFQLNEDLHFIHELNHKIAASASETAKLQLLLKKIYDAGDIHAKRIYEEAAAELWLAIQATAVKLAFANETFNVSYSGGLFKSGDCILAPLARLVQKSGVLRTPRFEPDMGAVLMAMRANDPCMCFDKFRP